MSQRGRPLGDVSRAVLQALAAQPRSVHQLARDLQAGQRLMVVTTSRLKAAGRIVAVDRARSSRSGRPVDVLAPAPEPAAEDRGSWPAWLR